MLGTKAVMVEMWALTSTSHVMVGANKQAEVLTCFSSHICLLAELCAYPIFCIINVLFNFKISNAMKVKTKEDIVQTVVKLVKKILPGLVSNTQIPT
jgi:hypothetical protein